MVENVKNRLAIFIWRREVFDRNTCTTIACSDQDASIENIVWFPHLLQSSYIISEAYLNWSYSKWNKITWNTSIMPWNCNITSFLFVSLTSNKLLKRCTGLRIMTRQLRDIKLTNYWLAEIHYSYSLRVRTLESQKKCETESSSPSSFLTRRSFMDRMRGISGVKGSKKSNFLSHTFTLFQ